VFLLSKVSTSFDSLSAPALQRSVTTLSTEESNMLMNRTSMILSLAGLLSVAGCSSMGGSANKGTASAAQQMLAQDQNALAQADAEYKDAILKHGEGSKQAISAKTHRETARNKYVADQQHVEQWRRVQATEPNPVESATLNSQSTQGASGSTH
jgi:hypothetical protein